MWLCLNPFQFALHFFIASFAVLLSACLSTAFDLRLAKNDDAFIDRVEEVSEGAVLLNSEPSVDSGEGSLALLDNERVRAELGTCIDDVPGADVDKSFILSSPASGSSVSTIADESSGLGVDGAGTERARPDDDSG